MAARRRNDSSSSLKGLSQPATIKSPPTMEDWDSKAPLSEVATQSIAALKKACERRPMPLKVRLYCVLHSERLPSSISQPNHSSLKKQSHLLASQHRSCPHFPRRDLPPQKVLNYPSPMVLTIPFILPSLLLLHNNFTIGLRLSNAPFRIHKNHISENIYKWSRNILRGVI